VTYSNVKLSIELDSGNDVIVSDTSTEIVRLLEHVIDRVKHSDNDCCEGKLRDLNGNTVGTFALYSEI